MPCSHAASERGIQIQEAFLSLERPFCPFPYKCFLSFTFPLSHSRCSLLLFVGLSRVSQDAQGKFPLFPPIWFYACQRVLGQTAALPGRQCQQHWHCCNRVLKQSHNFYLGWASIYFPKRCSKLSECILTTETAAPPGFTFHLGGAKPQGTRPN